MVVGPGSFEGCNDGEFEGVPPIDGGQDGADQLPGMHFLPGNAAEQMAEASPGIPQTLEVSDFIMAHDATHPKVPAKDVAVVRRGFESIVTAMLLAYVQDAVPGDDTELIGSDDPEIELLYKLPLTDGGYYRISVSATAGTKDTDPAYRLNPLTRTVREIEITRRPESGTPALYRWTEYADGSVCRYTNADFGASLRRIQESGLFSSALSYDETIRKIREFLQEEVENQRLEETMGYQHQQVGIREINGLAAFLRQPGIEIQDPYSDIGE